MSNKQLAPSSKSVTSVAEFRKVATPWVAFIAEQPNDIAGQNADPDGTIEDSVDISDPRYDENKTRIIEVQYAEKDHLEPPVHVNTLDASSDEKVSAENQNSTDSTGKTLEDQPKNSDPTEAAALLDMSEIYEPKPDESSS